MKLATGALSFGPKVKINLDLIRHAETLGFDSAWTAEAPNAESNARAATAVVRA